MQIFFQASAELAVNTPDQQVVGEVVQPNGLVALKLGSIDQPVLESKGDDLRIDWGYLYLAAPNNEVSSYSDRRSGSTARLLY